MHSLKTIFRWSEARRGNVLVMSAAALVGVVGFTALTVDIGYVSLTKTQMQAAADAAALAGGMELLEGWGPGDRPSSYVVATEARQAAVEVAAEHQAGDWNSVQLDPNSDIRFGQAQWNAASGEWVKVWGATPYNMVEVSVHRGSSGHAPLPLFFAPVLGQKEADITVTAVAALVPGTGFGIDPGDKQNAEILPMTIHKKKWAEMRGGQGDDDFAYNPDNGQVNNGSDGMLEISLFPQNHGGNGKGKGKGKGKGGKGKKKGGSGLTPGNFGTVDIGASNNSTKDLKRQIRHGVNDSDLAYHGGELNLEDGPIELNGDTGISAAIKDPLKEIIGRPSAIPLYSTVSGPGNNAMYTITEFVGVRVVDVKLTGGNKYVKVQAAPFSDSTVIGDKSLIASGEPINPHHTVFEPIQLIE